MHALGRVVLKGGPAEQPRLARLRIGVRELATQLGDDFGLVFVALSYRWLTKAHPDPEGHHLAIVAAVALTSALFSGSVGYCFDPAQR